MHEIEAQRPDVVIVDLSLEGENGIELIENIQARWPRIKMLVSSAHDERVFAGRVLRAGALGYLSKREAIVKIVEAIRRVLHGEVYLDGATASSLLKRAAAGKALDGDPTQTLSNRELQVFELIGKGHNTRQIARQLGISPKTIESHRQVIKTKLNAATSAQLSQIAFQWVQENI
jgi:DNA-binding NarL/FixJ family response regulator